MGLPMVEHKSMRCYITPALIAAHSGWSGAMARVNELLPPPRHQAKRSGVIY